MTNKENVEFVIRKFTNTNDCEIELEFDEALYLQSHDNHLYLKATLKVDNILIGTYYSDVEIKEGYAYDRDKQEDDIYETVLIDLAVNGIFTYIQRIKNLTK